MIFIEAESKDLEFRLFPLKVCLVLACLSLLMTEEEFREFQNLGVGIEVEHILHIPLKG